jgi:DNA (cytosine-5)-methyltransferase 1
MFGKPTVISTFCGTGGSSLGYKWAGFKELLAIDFDNHAVECFKANFPEVPVWKKSVVDITGKEIMDFCGIKSGELDVFDGSPPCQGFSTAGKREVCDLRNNLFMHYWRLVDELQPKVFVMENVTGMIKGKMKGKFIEIMQTLKGGNYVVKCKQMNSKYYGVPQSRDRLIFIGVRKDLNKIPIFPTPGKKIISVQKTIGRFGFIVYRHNYSSGKCKFAKKTFKDPLPTLTKTKCWKVFPKYFTVKELCALCSFPKDWILGNSENLAHERLGNAVMPKFMQAIAETIKEKILNATS